MTAASIPAPPGGSAEAAGAAATRALRVAYVMSRFPKISETFVLYEILALEALGLRVEVFPLLRERQAVVHPEAAAVVARAHYHPFVSWPILAAHLHFIRRRPRAYWGVLAEVLRGTWGSLNFFVGALGTFPKAVRLAYEMRALGVAHVHAHFANHPALVALVVHRLVDIPFSFTAHGSDLHVERRMLDNKVGAAAFVVAVSEFNKDLIISECGEAACDKVHVVHCGVDSTVFTPRADSGHGDGTLRLLCVASLEEVKGHQYLVEACRLLQAHGLRFRCDLVGDGPRRAAVAAQIAHADLGAHVHLHGLLPRPEVRRLMAAADIFCLPSVPTREGKREGIPVVLMEAMASGVPVLSSRLSGIPELVESGVSGILVEPRDSAGLAAAILALASDPAQRARLGQAGRRQVETHFDLHANARRLAALFARRATAPSSGPDTTTREPVTSGSA